MPTAEQVKEAIKTKLVSGEYDQAKAQAVWNNFKASQQPNQQQAQQPAAIQQPEPQNIEQAEEELPIGKKVIGALDAAGFVLGHSILNVGAGLGGLATGAVTVDLNKANEMVSTIQNSANNEPITRGGKEALAAVGDAIQGITNLVNTGTGAAAGLAEIIVGSDDGVVSLDTIERAKETYKSVQEVGLGKTIGDRVFEETGNPEAATAAFMAPDVFLETVGAKGLNSFKRAPNQLPTNLKKAVVEAAPDAKDIKKRATDLYAELDQMNIGIDQESYLNFAIKVRDKALDMGLDPGSDLTDKANHVLNRIDFELQSGKNMTLSDMDRLRRVAAVAAGDVTNKTNSAIGSEIINSIDDFIDSQAGRFAKSGPDVGKKFNEARDLWSRYRKSEVLDKAIYDAGLVKGGVESGLRGEFIKILKSDRKRRGFSKEEIEAMEVIAKGTSLERTFSKLGTMGVGLDQRRNFLGASIGMGAGAAGGTAAAGPLGGAIGAVAVPALGTFSAKMAQKMITNNHKFADALVKAGKDGTKIAREYFKAVPVKDRTVKDLTELLMMSEGKVSSFGDAGMRKIIRDAAFVAEEFKKAGQTSLMAVPLVEQAQEDNQ